MTAFFYVKQKGKNQPTKQTNKNPSFITEIEKKKARLLEILKCLSKLKPKLKFQNIYTRIKLLHIRRLKPHSDKNSYF